MYIEGKYWHNYIGDTDDSLTLVDYLVGKQREELGVGEILADFGLVKLGNNLRAHEEPLVFVDAAGWETEIYYAIDLITDLAALLLECKRSGYVDLGELAGDEASIPKLWLSATAAEHELLNEALADFVAEPLAYDLSEMCPEEDMQEMAALCEELRRELYEK